MLQVQLKATNLWESTLSAAVTVERAPPKEKEREPRAQRGHPGKIRESAAAACRVDPEHHPAPGSPIRPSSPSCFAFLPPNFSSSASSPSPALFPHCSERVSSAATHVPASYLVFRSSILGLPLTKERLVVTPSRHCSAYTAAPPPPSSSYCAPTLFDVASTQWQRRRRILSLPPLRSTLLIFSAPAIRYVKAVSSLHYLVSLSSSPLCLTHHPPSQQQQRVAAHTNPNHSTPRPGSVMTSHPKHMPATKCTPFPHCYTHTHLTHQRMLRNHHVFQS